MAATAADDIWAEMQREEQTAGRARRKNGGARPAAAPAQLAWERPKKPTVKHLDSSLQWMQSWSVSVKPAESAPKGFDPKALPSSTAPAAMSGPLDEPPATLIDAVDDVPIDDPETFVAYIQRDVNCLAEANVGVRQQSLVKLERLLVQQAERLPSDVMDAAADALLRPLLKRLRDKSERCRELSVRILRSLLEEISDLRSALAYIFPTLVARLGSEDLDGVAHLPEVMRPAPEQKPTEIVRPVEPSEEVRLQLAQLVRSALARCSQTTVLSYIDEATGLLRAGCMDPFHEVKICSMETMISFCHSHTEMLLHFAEPLARSLTSCLTHSHARVRILALRALTATLWCGVWKHNFEILQILMAWQDPNQVQIKAFYEPVTQVNYMSVLSFDRHPAVRRFWFETLGHWLLRIPDKVDHEPYIFPYLLTGLCDENEEIAIEVFWLIEKCGELYEAEHEEDLRKTKQYGLDLGWTYQGRAFVPFPLRGLWAGGGAAGSVRRVAAQGPDLMGEKERQRHLQRDALDEEVDGEVEVPMGDELVLPERDYAWPEVRELQVYRQLPRPRLGSRCWVRTHTRRYIKATFNDVVDFRDCTALNAGRLLCMSLAYTEEGVTEWLQPMFAALSKFYSGRAWAAGDSEAGRTYETVCKLLGCFLDPVSYWEQLRQALDDDCSLDLDQRVAMLHVLRLCIEGSVETLQSVQPPDPNLGLGRLKKVVPELISAMHASDLLLCLSDASRRVLWSLLFAFLEPLRDHLSLTQLSQLLYVALALAAQKAPEEKPEVPGSEVLGDFVDPEAQELVDQEKLERAMAALSAAAAPLLSAGQRKMLALPPAGLDELDELPAPVVPAASDGGDPRVIHGPLFERAFAEILAHSEDSFQIFQNVVYLSPLAVLSSDSHASTVLERLASFGGSRATPGVRSACHALSVHLALRAARVLQAAPGADAGSAAALRSRRFIWQVLRVQSEALAASSRDAKTLSYQTIVGGILLWRRLLRCKDISIQDFLFAPDDRSQPSAPIAWLMALLADQELYKKFHKALQLVEATHTGKDSNDFVIMKAKQIREDSEQRALVVRALAGSTLVLLLRRLRLSAAGDGSGSAETLWPEAGRQGSLQELFKGAASLFRTATATMEPAWVKPTPAVLTLYAAELLHLLHHQVAGPLPEAFRLRDDAARTICHLEVAAATPSAPPCALKDEECNVLVTDFVTTLIDLNLTLPPDPDAKHAPTTLSAASDDEIRLGGEGEIEGVAAATSRPVEAQGKREPPQGDGRGVLPREVVRMLSQSDDCLRWNAALALYMLATDFLAVSGVRGGFQRCLQRWQMRGEQAKVLITVDLLRRCGGSGSGASDTPGAPRALAPPAS